MFTIKIDTKQIDEVIKALDPKKALKIMMRTLNKVGAQGKTAISRELRETYNIKKQRLDKAFFINQATIFSQAFELTARERTPGLQHYDARKTRKGVTVKVISSSGRKTVAHGFMANTPQGAIAIWKMKTEPKRLMKMGRYAGTNTQRVPIKRLYGPSVPGMINRVGINSFEKVVNEKLNSVFSHEFDWEMSRR